VVTLIFPKGVLPQALEHLAGVEQVGFFLADWVPQERSFRISSWQPVTSSGYAIQTDYHVRLNDDAKAEMIRWAWDSDKCLIEAHSHGPRGRARFSPSDLAGFEEWVPHLWWRLQKRPYAAIVTQGETFDGWAWIENATDAEQVLALEAPEATHRATGETTDWLEGAAWGS
jgi:hypothetical protein